MSSGNSKRKWPFPGDSPVVRARKTALAYREIARGMRAETEALAEAIRKIDPRIIAWIEDDDFTKLYKEIQAKAYPMDNPIDALDQRIFSWGEEWHAEIEETYNDDDWITAKVAAKILGVAPNTVSRMRNRGRLAGRLEEKQFGDPGGGTFMYRYGDVIALSSEVRTRGSRVEEVTDTVQGREK